MYTIYTIKNALYIVLLSTIFCFHKVNGMENEEEDTIEVKQLFYIDDEEKREGTYYDSVTDNNQLPPPNESQFSVQTENCILHCCHYSSQKRTIYSCGIDLKEKPNKQFTMPQYDYANKKIINSAFYGKTNINHLINTLKIEPAYFEPINIASICIGASVVLTALSELCKAADNTSHCIDTITQEQAKNIIEKINQGYIILDVPMFSMQHTQVMVFASRLSSLITVNIIGCCVYYLLKKYNQKNSCFNVALVFGLALLLYNPLIKKYSNFYDKKIIPWLISENYNPNLDTPLQAAQNIRKHIKCPILIHISNNDELLWCSKKDILQLWNALLNNPLDHDNNSPTYLLLSGDGTHDQGNNDFEYIKQQFTTNLKEYEPAGRISPGNGMHPNSNVYDWRLKEEPVYITYKEPLFPLISSGIAVAKTIGRLWK